MKSPARLSLGLALATFVPFLSAQQLPSNLLQELSAANDHAVTAWRSQDRAAFSATFAPDAH